MNAEQKNTYILQIKLLTHKNKNEPRNQRVTITKDRNDVHCERKIQICPEFSAVSHWAVIKPHL